MAEIRSGLRHMLALPLVYDTFQRMLGAYAWRTRVIENVVKPRLKPEARVIDIGCGTCDVLHHLPADIDYHGFDRNESYINAARKQFHGRRATFECRSVGDDPLGLKPFDVALAFGLMHHLDDAEVIALLRTAKGLLAPEGQLFMLDPLFTPQQSRASRFIVSKDRGRNIRTIEGYVALCEREFSFVRTEVDLDPLRIPYTGIVTTCSSATAGIAPTQFPDVPLPAPKS